MLKIQKKIKQLRCDHLYEFIPKKMPLHAYYVCKKCGKVVCLRIKY